MSKVRHHTYKGRPIEELTHEELLVAARWAFDTIQQQRDDAEQEREMQDLFERARRR